MAAVASTSHQMILENKPLVKVKEVDVTSSFSNESTSVCSYQVVA